MVTDFAGVASGGGPMGRIRRYGAGEVRLRTARPAVAYPPRRKRRSSAC
ncbi:hypothetical protein FAIPA1_30171 [Frankia sp. AiPs1]